MKMISVKSKYAEKVVAKMKKKFGYKNDLEVPRIQKVVINSGIGKISKENDKIEEVIRSLSEIAGQKTIKTKAKKAISGFKVREGMDVGVAVTLRGKKMWWFIDRLINVALPRTRDFQGIDKKSVDSGGNLNIGIKEHMIFPEIIPEKVKHIFGFQINIVSTAKNREEGMELLKLLGFPIKQ